MTRADRSVVIFFVGCSFIGIWYALPMLSVVFDEQYFVGGVLRAIEMRSILPLPNEVPYGTITFYLNYALQVPFLLVLFAWKGFSIVALKTYLILHPEAAYLVPRFLSALVASVVAVLYDRFLRSEDVPLVQRFAVLSVIFSTIIGAVTLHTGKMWVLSAALAAASALCTYIALKNRSRGSSEPKYGPVFWGIVFSFAALANFPLNGIFLVNVPILLYAFRNDRVRLYAAVRAVCAGGIVFLAALAANFQSTYSLILHTVAGEVAPNWDGGTSAIAQPLLTSLFFHAEQVLAAFPLVIAVIALALGVRAVQNKLLFSLSSMYAALYFLTIVGIVPRIDDLGRVLHYLFPLAFFLSGALASIAYQRMRYVLWGFCVLQTVTFIYTLYLLSVQTTFNTAASFIEQNLKHEHALILNEVVELSLPLNKETTLLRSDELCGSKCLYWRSAAHDADFLPAVVPSRNQLGNMDISSYSRVLWITDQRPIEACLSEPIAIFLSGSSDTGYVSVEYNLGNYFHTDFWRLSRLGKNLRMYELSKQCAATIFSSNGT